MFFLHVLSNRVLYVLEHGKAEDTAAVIPCYSNNAGTSHSGPMGFSCVFQGGTAACSQPCTVARDLPVLCGGRTLVKVFPSNTSARKNF